MKYDVNPFHVLYVTDSPDPGLFVEVFSDLPIRFSQPVFQSGNVVLKGTQGSGKSMLLNLLKPQIRLAYHKAGVEFPVHGDLRNYVGAGINLTLSGALDIGQRPIGKDESSNDYPLFFADFLNYYVVRDLLRTITLMSKEHEAFESLVTSKNLDRFAKEYSAQPCWFGALSKTSTIDELIHKIDLRIATYRSFHQFNSDLTDSICSTKTNIGEPIAAAEELMKDIGVIKRSTLVLISIDQIERLYRSDVLRPELGQEYRRVINKAVGKRDSRISYRIGTRPYAWEDDLTVFRTGDKLEHIRDYRVVDLDEKMRRKENSNTWLFPQFAEDAFRRRLKMVGLSTYKKKDWLSAIFGNTPSPIDLASSYSRNSEPDKVLRLSDDFSEEWKDYLRVLYAEDPFNAVLAGAWARQGRSKTKGESRFSVAPPTSDRAPWKKTTWRKERTRQALLQIAARCSQRVRWAGKDTILALSAPNISVFLSVCHEIWDAFLRSERRKQFNDRADVFRDGLSTDIQSVGIETASKDWYMKIRELPGGHDRQRFVDVLARSFRSSLLDDIAMSYPGHNGFSLAAADLETKPDIARFLNDATDYGDLFSTEHTTRGSDRKRRRKWYLSPILSAYFQIPEVHTKEPYYAKINEVIGWLFEAQVHIESTNAIDSLQKKRKARKRHDQQQFNFGPEEDTE